MIWEKICKKNIGNEDIPGGFIDLADGAVCDSPFFVTEINVFPPELVFLFLCIFSKLLSIHGLL